MQKFIVFVFCVVVGMVVLGYARDDVPKEIMDFLENQIDQYNIRGLLSAKESGQVHDSVQIKDLKIERIIQIYKLKHIFLDSYIDTVSFSEIIEPSGKWFVLITANNKPIYDLYLDNSKGEPKYVGMGHLNPNSTYRNMWNLLLKTYPESTGINPVLFSQYGSFPFEKEDRFLYFKQKGPRKIFSLRFGRRSGNPLDTLFTGSIETLDDSKKLMEHWKRKGLNEVGITPDELERRRAQEAKDGGKK